MQKSQISFDAKQLKKELMRDGYVDLDIIPLKEERPKLNKDKQTVEGVDKNGNKWIIMQNGFVKQSNRNKDAEMPIIGSQTYFKTIESDTQEPVIDYPEDSISPEDIPFN